MSDNLWSCPHQCDARTCPACRGQPASEPDPRNARKEQPLTMLFIGATEAQKDTMLSKECMASSWSDVFAERDSLCAKIAELKNALHVYADKYGHEAAECDSLREKNAELEAHLRDSDREIIAMERERDEARAEAARLREALEQIANGSQDIMSQRIAREALAPRETEGGR